MKSPVQITDFCPEHQSGIDALLSGIQNEYPEQIYGPGIQKMIDVAFMPGRKYRVALSDGVVIGSIGVVLLSSHNACLKSMLLHKDYRGSGIADQLLYIAIEYCRVNQVGNIFLGTMIQFRAAQYFYKKHGFTEITEDGLPADFMKNPVDKVFFKWSRT